MYANSRNFMIIVVNICWGVVGIVGQSETPVGMLNLHC